MHASLLDVRVLHAYLLDVRVLHAYLLDARVLHAYLLDVRVLHAYLLDARVLHAGILDESISGGRQANSAALEGGRLFGPNFPASHKICGGIVCQACSLFLFSVLMLLSCVVGPLFYLFLFFLRPLPSFRFCFLVYTGDR